MTRLNDQALLSLAKDLADRAIRGEQPTSFQQMELQSLDCDQLARVHWFSEGASYAAGLRLAITIDAPSAHLPSDEPVASVAMPPCWHRIARSERIKALAETARGYLIGIGLTLSLAGVIHACGVWAR